MKKLLFILSAPLVTIFPITLLSCSQNNTEDRIFEAEEKIQKIILEKPLPTLSTKPTTNIVDLENYLKIQSFNNPVTEITGVKIEINDIELPIVNSKDLLIWLKVTSTDTLDIAPEISGFYSINLSEILEMKDKTINSIPYEKLKILFDELLEPNLGNITKIVSNAIFGIDEFEGETSIDTSTLEQDPKPLNDRLTTSNINQYIFDGYQQNIHMLFKSIENNIIVFDFIFGDSIDGIPEEVITITKPIDIFQTRNL